MVGAWSIWRQGMGCSCLAYISFIQAVNSIADRHVQRRVTISNSALFRDRERNAWFITFLTHSCSFFVCYLVFFKIRNIYYLSNEHAYHLGGARAGHLYLSGVTVLPMKSFFPVTLKKESPEYMHYAAFSSKKQWLSGTHLLTFQQHPKSSCYNEMPSC